jgi:hypothetical protein
MLNTYFPQIYNRLNSVIKKIAQEYYKNYEDKKYLNSSKSTDEEGNIVDNETSSSIIEGLSESSVNYFVSTVVDLGLVKMSAETNNIPYSTLFQTISDIRLSTPPEKLQELFSSILSVIYDSDNSLLARVCSADFATTAIKQLSISNSNNVNLNKLKSILEKTLGVPIFQEQIMKIVVAVADFSPGESDELRRIMSSAWKRKASMAGVKERILIGFQNNGVSDQYAEKIFKTIEGFSNYGFPESHSASFAMLTA